MNLHLLSKFKSYSFLLLFNFTFVNTLICQKNILAEIDTSPSDSMDYYINSASVEYVKLIQFICKINGFPNYDIIPRIEKKIKAKAYIKKAENKLEKILEYNDLYLNTIRKNSRTNCGIIFILAHEIAHHTRGHTLESANKDTQHREELDADYYAGHTLGLMRAPRSEIETLDILLNEKEDSGHPSRDARQKEIWQGYNNAIKVSTPPLVTNKTGTISFYNNTGSMIRVTKIVNKKWLDTKNRIELPHAKSTMDYVMSIGFEDFYIEISVGKDKWGHKWKLQETIKYDIQKDIKETITIEKKKYP